MEIKPFRAYRYQESSGLGQQICPPYDKINPAHREQLLQRHPHNFVRVILGPDYPPPSSWYDEASETMTSWCQQNILIQDPQPGFYLLHQTFTNPWTKTKHHRWGFVGLLKLPEGGQGVRPHERTFDIPKAERLKFMQAIPGNMEPIFVLYQDRDNQLITQLQQQALQLAACTDEFGTEIELYQQSDPQKIADVSPVFADQDLFIADGHHRFETACKFRDLCREQFPDAGPEAPFEYMMMYLCAFEDPGLCVLPTHRVLQNVAPEKLEQLEPRLSEFFELQPCENLDQALSVLVNDTNERMVFALVLPSGVKLGRLTSVTKAESLLGSGIPAPIRKLDVALLHGLIFEHLLDLNRETDAPGSIVMASEVKDINAMLAAGAQAAFVLRATLPQQVRDVASVGARMPQKSTDFFPKIPSGLVLFLHDQRQ